MNRMKYASATALSGLLMLSGPAAGAASAASGHSAPTQAVRPSISAKATVGSVRAWQQFRIYGKTQHLRAGTRVTLQQWQGSHKKWVALPASMATNRSGAYDLRVKLGLIGKNSLRIVGGGATSPVVTVTVRR